MQAPIITASEIEAWLARNRIRPSSFGVYLLNDRDFLVRLRGGRARERSVRLLRFVVDRFPHVPRQGMKSAVQHAKREFADLESAAHSHPHHDGNTRSPAGEAIHVCGAPQL